MLFCIHNDHHVFEMWYPSARVSQKALKEWLKHFASLGTARAPKRISFLQRHQPVEQFVQDAEDLDFGGFRTILLFNRHRPEYPPPEQYDTAVMPSVEGLGGCLPPIPRLITKGTKPVSVATIRVGDNYLEVPFFATADNHRGKGYGRCLLEAIEAVCDSC
jgi:GNAT superfamily N-acetyltransferase